MTNSDLPALQPPDSTAAIRATAHLGRHWRALMGPLGFSDRRLWMLMLEENGRPTPVVAQFTDLPQLPDQQLLTSLMHVTERVCRGLGNGSVAFLLSRPGAADTSASDRAWAQQLAAAARQAGVALWPLHIATDEDMVVLTTEDRSEPRGA